LAGALPGVPHFGADYLEPERPGEARFARLKPRRPGSNPGRQAVWSV